MISNATSKKSSHTTELSLTADTAAMKINGSGLDAMLLSHSGDPGVFFHFTDVVAVVVGKDLQSTTKKSWIPNSIAPQHFQFRTTPNLDRLPCVRTQSNNMHV